MSEGARQPSLDRPALLALAITRGILQWGAAYAAACLAVAVGFWPAPPPLSDRVVAAMTSPITVAMLAFAGGAFAARALTAARGDELLWRRGTAIAGAVALIALLLVHRWTTERLVIFDFRAGVPTLRPDADLVIDRISSRRSIRVHTNEAGFRDRAWGPRHRREGERRVLLTGDSFTFGVGIPDDEATLARTLERELGARGRYAVFNVALSGLNFRQEVDLVERFAPEVDPDLVVVVHNEGNDLAPALDHFVNPGLVGWLFPAELVHLRATDAWLQTWRPLHDPEALAGFFADQGRLARIASARGFDVLFAQIEGWCPPGYGPAAGAPGRIFAYIPIDLRRLHGDATDSDGPIILSEDDPHPNENGVLRMARRLAPAIAAIEEQRARWIARGGPDDLSAAYQRTCDAEGDQRGGP